jgi:hypothetical protein
VLPCEVRVTSALHPLFGSALSANAFKRWDGALLLVVVLPDGSPGTIPADATSVFGDRCEEMSSSPIVSVLSADGVRRLRLLVDAITESAGSAGRARTRK